MPARKVDAQRNAVVYLRQSLDRFGTEDAITRQREDDENLARARGLTIVAVHADNDTSAKGRVRRPGFDAVLADIAAGKASVIIAWSLDRLTRNPRDRLRLIETCQKASAVVSLVRGSDIDMSTPAGRLTADILASVAQHEIEVKSDRQIRANQQAAQAGRRVGGRRPFGYEQDGKTIRPDEAQAVADGFHAYLAGTPIAAIARNWNARGFTAQLAPWKRYSVQMVLANPRYMGYRGYAPADPDRRGRARMEIVAKAEWPPIVDESVWHGVNRKLEERAASAIHGGARLLLTGVALCGVCVAKGNTEGRKPTVHAGGAVRKYPMYRCSKTVGHVQRKAQPVDDYVSAYMIARLSRPDARKLLSDQSRPDMMVLQREHEAIVQQRKATLRALAGDLSPEDFRVVNDEYKTRLGEIEKLMGDAEQTAVLGPLVDADDTEAAWEALPRDHQRAAIDRLMTVTLYPAGRGTRIFRPETVKVEPKR